MIENYGLKEQASGVCRYCGASADMDCFCDEFFRNIEKTPTCWIWKGSKLKTHKIEYGMFYKTTRKGILAHRYSYQIFKGRIPKDKVIDHLCRNGLCVNPEHLEVVTNKENILRGQGKPAMNNRKTICFAGHKLSGDNLKIRKDGRRVCVQCTKDYEQFRRKRE